MKRYTRVKDDPWGLTVVKANEIIQRSRFSLTTQQQKIILYLISQINPFDDDFKEYEFSITDFCRICGLDYKSGKNYSDLKEAIKDIADKSMWIRLENGDETLVRWIEKAKIQGKSGNVRIRLDNDLKPYLLQLKSNYTTYELLWSLNFRSKYTIRLYELIKSLHYNELKPYEKIYSVDELRGLLGAETYTTYPKFKEKALKPAVEEINLYSDKVLEVYPLKEGRATTHLRLVITSKDSIEALVLREEIEKKFGLNQISLLEDGVIK